MIVAFVGYAVVLIFDAGTNQPNSDHAESHNAPMGYIVSQK